MPPCINGLYPQYVYSDTLNITDEYNDQIKMEIYRLLENESKGEESVTNFSKYTLKEIKQNPVFAPILAYIKDHVNFFLKAINKDQELVYTNIWLSISYPGQFHNIHLHNGSDLAGVYYVQANSEMKLHFVNSNNQLYTRDHEENLWSKKLLLFDGSLVHGFVPVKQGSEPKITIAFNMRKPL